jgi:hypothetical protein
LEVFISRRFKRPISDESFAQNVIPRDGTPEATILAVIPVIPHGEIMALGNLIRPIVVVNASWINILGIVFFQGLAIDINGVTYHFDSIPGHPHQPLDICDLGTIRVFEDNHVSAFGPLVREKFGKESGMKAINEFVDKKMVANEEVGFHGSCGNFESLNHKSGGKERNDSSDDDGFKIFSNRRFAEFQRCLL